MAMYDVRRVLFAMAPISVWQTDDGIMWLPLEGDSNCLATVLGMPAGTIIDIVDAWAKTLAPDGVAAEWVVYIPVQGTTRPCITYALFMALIMAKLLPYGGLLLDVGPVY